MVSKNDKPVKATKKEMSLAEAKALVAANRKPGRKKAKGIENPGKRLVKGIGKLQRRRGIVGIGVNTSLLAGGIIVGGAIIDSFGTSKKVLMALKEMKEEDVPTATFFHDRIKQMTPIARAINPFSP